LVRVAASLTNAAPLRVLYFSKSSGWEHDVVKRTGAVLAGPVLLPVQIKKYCVLRSPHGDKKSREQFEMRIHKRLIDITEPTPNTVEELMKLDLPAGVDVEIKSS